MIVTGALDSPGTPSGVGYGEERHSFPYSMREGLRLPTENVSKINVKIACFSAYWPAEMVSSAVLSRQQWN